MSNDGELGDVQCTFECDASSAEWLVLSASVSEELNQPYELSAALSTDDVDADGTEILGKSCTLVFERGDLTNPYPAIVHRVEDTAAGDRIKEIRVWAAPALWLLSQNRQTRIFQEMTVPDILDKVLGDGLSAYDRKHETDLSRAYPTCEYRLQYDESDWAFCERLMEEEGIIYWFNRDDSAEVLFLTDDPHASRDVESRDGGKDVAFSAHMGARECVDNFRRSSSMRPTKLSMRHFNWTLPSLFIEEEQEGQAEGGGADGSAIGPTRETYEHDLVPPTLHEYTDGDGYQENDAKAQCEIRRDLEARDKLVMQGSGAVVGFCAGGAFNLTTHDLGGEYVLTTVTHSFNSRSATYSNGFDCIPAETPYRPNRHTPKPRVFGLETATVVGPSGQEIHTDKHGRIKVQFHWDREGQNDDLSSCFIRVVQPWAGAGWGFLFLPRIGMEVTVAFVQGDPDRPIVTGCVYNGENLTSYEMPNEMTKSTIRTQSSPGGDGYNELSFEDKAGDEEVFLQAQKNLTEVVKNDHATSVGNDQSLDVGNDQTETVGNDQTITVDNDQSLTITKNQTVDVGEDKSEKIGKNLTHDVGEDLTQSVGGSKSEEITGSRTSTAGESWSADAGDSLTLQSGKDTEMKADKNILIASEEAMDVQSGKDFTVNGKAKGTIKIQDELRIEVGQASITLKSGGDIIISGGKIEVKGQSDVVIKGAKTSIN